MTLITGKTVVKNNYGATVIGAKIYSKLIQAPSNPAVYDNEDRLTLSGVAGITDITNLQTGAIYQFWRENSDRLQYRIPDDVVSPYLLPPIIGRDTSVLVTSDEDDNIIPITAEFATKLALNFTVYNNLGVITADEKVYSQMIIPPLVYGVTFDNSVREIVSDALGKVKFTNLEPNAIYHFWTDYSDKIRYRIPIGIVNACP